MGRNDALAATLGDHTRRRTSQNEQVPGRPEQIVNDAGGYGFAVDDLTHFRRFLILGIEGGTFYVSEKDHADLNSKLVIKLVAERPLDMLSTLVDVSVNGLAKKQNPTLYALAVLCAQAEDAAVRNNAWLAVSKVARTSSMLMTFTKYFMLMGSTTRRTAKRGYANWYASRSVEQLAYQMVKYRTRAGISQRDMLKLSRVPSNIDSGLDRHALYEWVLGREVHDGNLPLQVQGFRKIQGEIMKPKDAAKIINETGLPWEAVPDYLINEPAVLEALLNGGMPMHALIRQLPRITRAGVIGTGKGNLTSKVAQALSRPDVLRKARVHPVTLLLAGKAYAYGRAAMGDAAFWSPSTKIVDALDEAFYSAFEFLEPTGKRFLIGIDCSGSMDDPIMGLNLSHREAAVAMAMAIHRQEGTAGDVTIMGFTTASGRRPSHSFDWRADSKMTPMDVSSRRRMDDNLRVARSIPMGGTDCAQPYLWAAQNNAPVDVFITLTDNETWTGGVQPFQALRDYRAKSGIRDAKGIVVATSATGFTIADPRDPGMLDISGMSPDVPTLINNFALGRV